MTEHAFSSVPTENGKIRNSSDVTLALSLVVRVLAQLMGVLPVQSVNTLTTSSVNNAQSQIVMTVSTQIRAGLVKTDGTKIM
jgi:hypothetical protein